MRKKVSLLLVAIIAITTILPIMIVNAAGELMTLSASRSGKVLTSGQIIDVETTDTNRKINVTVDVDSTTELVIYYSWDKNGLNIASKGSKTATITIPNFEAGTRHILQIEAVINDHANNLVGNSNIVSLGINVPAAEPTVVTTKLQNGSTTLKVNSTTELAVGTKLNLTATSNRKVSAVAYKWDSETQIQNAGSAATIVVPNYEAGSTHKLQVRAVAEDNTLSDLTAYYITIPAPVVPTEISVSLKKGSTTLTPNTIVKVDVGTTLNLVATSNKTVKAVAYKWDSENFVQVNGSTTKIIVPNYTAGTSHKLQVRAVAEDNTLSDLLIYTIQIPEAVIEPEDTEISVSLKKGSATLTPNSVVKAEVGTTLKLVATSNKTVKAVAYKWDSEDFIQINANSTNIIVPNYAAGTSHKLQIRAAAEDNTLSDLLIYTIQIPEAIIEPEETEITVGLRYEGSNVSTSKDLYVYLNDELDVYTTCNIDVEKIVYYWDDEDDQTIKAAKGVIEIPSDFEIDSEHTLTIQAIAKDGTKSSIKEYTIIIDEEYEENDDDELIIEPWMEENDDLDTLAISLRNDSEEEKENKNIYELEEEIIYYVDYKNGGKDISKKVTLVLNIPETFKVVSSDGGSVSTSKGTITWNLNGLEEEEAGTKTVVLKYTKIGSSKVSYKIVKPLAEIKLDNKVKDESAVINLIYKDKDTEIKDLHLPYMFGDKDKPTFRPDDTITRAEGALVLTRIFGISTAYDNSSYNYPDLDETYLEARKAIIAATEYGIINGYEDGTYRPNKAMTRAEFLKIIANRVAIENDEGFEIKDLESSIKVYDDPTRVYVVGNEYLKNHWALEEVTLLARLNMTPLTESNINLRLDEPITRAEVAQLVNFYLLRAPADVTSKTKTEFSDVSKNHKLFADIVEATREEHTYYITDETTEEAEF